MNHAYSSLRQPWLPRPLAALGLLLGMAGAAHAQVPTFAPAIAYSTVGTNPNAVAVADVNGDGKLDLLTANRGNNTAGVLLGNGNGTFQAAATYSTGTDSQPHAIAVADVNGDGKPDLLTANYGSNSAGVLLNTTGFASTLTSFSPATGPVGTVVTLTGTNLGSVTAVRFNGTAASFVATSATSITARVAAGTTTGPVTITTPTGTATSTSSFVVRVAPTTVADAYTTPVGVPLMGNVLTNDLGTNPRAILINRPTHGTLLLNPDGTFTYQPAAGYSGPDSFLYYACNMGTPLVCGDPATVSLTVTPVTPSLTAAKYAVANARGTAAPNGSAAEALALTASPNPFGEELRLRFALSTAQAYTLALYDGQGRLVQQLASGQAEAGQPQELLLPTQPYATGLYLVRLTTATGTQLLKLVKH